MTFAEWWPENRLKIYTEGSLTDRELRGISERAWTAGYEAGARSGPQPDVQASGQVSDPGLRGVSDDLAVPDITSEPE